MGEGEVNIRELLRAIPAHPMLDEVQNCFEWTLGRIAALESQLAASEAKCAELERAVVWAVRRRASDRLPTPGNFCVEYDDWDDMGRRNLSFDGTDADLVRVVVEESKR